MILTPILLGDLWALDPVRTRKRIIRLGQVGLATVHRRPLTVRLHDLMVAWLHDRQGFPEDSAHHELHHRCAAPAMSADGNPGALTADRADWLTFHLCRTGSVDYPARLLRSGWQQTYRAATGADANYLDGLRMLVDHYGSLPSDLLAIAGVPSLQLEAWMLEGALLHAHISSQVGTIPVDVLVVRALLNQARPAVRQAAQYPEPQMAAYAILAVATALGNQGRLQPTVLDLATELASTKLTGLEQSRVLVGIAGLVASSDRPRAVHLTEQAERVATTIPDERQRSQVLATIARAVAGFDPDRAERLATTLPDEGQRSQVLATVARKLTGEDPVRSAALADQAERLATTLPDEWQRSEVLAEVAGLMAGHDPQRAVQLADQAEQVATTLPDERERSQALAEVARVVAGFDPDRAERLVTAIPYEWQRSEVLAEIARVVVTHDPDRARQLAAIFPESNRNDDLVGYIAAMQPEGRRRVYLATVLIERRLNAARSLRLAKGFLETWAKGGTDDQLSALARSVTNVVLGT